MINLYKLEERFLADVDKLQLRQHIKTWQKRYMQPEIYQKFAQSMLDEPLCKAYAAELFEGVVRVPWAEKYIPIGHYRTFKQHAEPIHEAAKHLPKNLLEEIAVTNLDEGIEKTHRMGKFTIQHLLMNSMGPMARAFSQYFDSDKSFLIATGFAEEFQDQLLYGQDQRAGNIWDYKISSTSKKIKGPKFRAEFTGKDGNLSFRIKKQEYPS